MTLAEKILQQLNEVLSSRTKRYLKYGAVGAAGLLALGLRQHLRHDLIQTIGHALEVPKPKVPIEPLDSYIPKEVPITQFVRPKAKEILDQKELAQKFFQWEK